MTNTVDEFIESLVAATINNEVKWNADPTEVQDIIEDVYGSAEKLFAFLDEETGAYVVLVSYQYCEGEVQAEEFIKDGASILLIDDEDFEILNEVTDEDVESAEIFTTLFQAIEEAKQAYLHLISAQHDLNLAETLKNGVFARFFIFKTQYM